MLNGAFSDSRNNSLLNEYSLMLSEAVLRHRTRTAEHAARIEAQLASQVKSEFVSNMSHELRTPLNTIIGFSKIMRDDNGPPRDHKEMVQYATLINDAATNLLAVINDILDISKIQSGRYTLDNQEICIEDVIADVIGQVEAEADEAQVTIAFEPTGGLPPVRGDEAKLAQMVLNITSNAIKFTHAGGQVAITALRTPSGGVAVQVTDSGVGMTEAQIEIALRPFGQIDGSRSRWREGAGLGLPIARALVELHGGNLTIESQPGRGTEVTILLPAAHLVSAPPKDQVAERSGF